MVCKSVLQVSIQFMSNVILEEDALTLMELLNQQGPVSECHDPKPDEWINRIRGMRIMAN